MKILLAQIYVEIVRYASSFYKLYQNEWDIMQKIYCRTKIWRSAIISNKGGTFQCRRTNLACAYLAADYLWSHSTNRTSINDSWDHLSSSSANRASTDPAVNYFRVHTSAKANIWLTCDFMRAQRAKRASTSHPGDFSWAQRFNKSYQTCVVIMFYLR